jgi:T-complex protein 1 subunit theta
VNAHEQGIWDLYLTKYWGLKYAASATNMILRVDQIIMAKRAGGPAPPKPGAVDEDD